MKITSRIKNLFAQQSILSVISFYNFSKFLLRINKKTYFSKMSLGNCTNKKPVLGFQYEPESLNVCQVCFHEEL